MTRVAKPIRAREIGLGIIGSGRIGTLRARLAAGHSAVTSIAVSDLDPANAARLADLVGGRSYGDDNRAVIDDPAVTAVIVTAPGRTGKTTTEPDGADAGPDPKRFRAVTVQAYVLPAVRCSTPMLWLELLSDRVTPPLLETHVALYEKIGDPPLDGFVNVTRTR